MGKIKLDDIKKSAIVINEPNFSDIDGKYLRSFRMRIKMSQALLADYLGVSKKAIEKWEQGKNKVNPVIARMIYLMENDPKVFSLLKNVKIGDEVFDINPVVIFKPDHIDYSNSIAKVDMEDNNIIDCSEKWRTNDNNTIGGLKYVNASI